jgi:hypothetical protein
MVILVPWDPVAFVLGLLSASIIVSYFGSALMRCGKRSLRYQHGALAARSRGSCQTTLRKPNPQSRLVANR